MHPFAEEKNRVEKNDPQVGEEVKALQVSATVRLPGVQQLASKLWEDTDGCKAA
jgi:hypothetical protein